MSEKLIEALEECLEWMEDLRISGDAGFWEWSETHQYTTGKKALAEHKAAEDKYLSVIEKLAIVAKNSPHTNICNMDVGGYPEDCTCGKYEALRDAGALNVKGE